MDRERARVGWHVSGEETAMQKCMRQIQAQLVLIQAALGEAVRETDELQRARCLAAVKSAWDAVQQDVDAVLAEEDGPVLRLVAGGN